MFLWLGQETGRVCPEDEKGDRPSAFDAAHSQWATEIPQHARLHKQSQSDTPGKAQCPYAASEPGDGQGGRGGGLSGMHLHIARRCNKDVGVVGAKLHKERPVAICRGEVLPTVCGRLSKQACMQHGSVGSGSAVRTAQHPKRQFTLRI